MKTSLQCKILSLDLWDTIVRRRCHPDEIKAMTAEYVCMRYGDCISDVWRKSLKMLDLRIQCEISLGANSREQGYDDEYELREVIKEWLGRAFVDSKKIKKETVEEIYQYELDRELEYTYLDAGIVEFIQNLKYEKLVIISDFYADTTFIGRVLKKVGFPYFVDKVYMSCEIHFNKRSSRLFKYVEKDLEIEPKEHLHIGDNLYSDVKIPRELGIVAVHYMPETENKNRKRREHAFRKEVQDTVLSYRDFPLEKTDISIFFSGFISWIAEYCMQHEIKKLYFFTREGEFYKQLFDIWKDNSRFKQKLPETWILEVSRIATFLPSIREVSINEMMRIWNQYSCQSMAAFFKSLRLNADVAKTFTEKCGIDFEAELTYPWQSKKVKELFNDKSFVHWFQNEIDTNKKLFLTYCYDKSLVESENERIGIVDIGWRGTIQDNLCYLFPNYFIEGFYIGLVQFLNEQPNNSNKHGYINFSSKSKILFHTLTPFEMICNSPNGSTISYYSEGKKVKALRKKEEGEDSVYYSFTQEYQAEIKRGLIELLKWNRKHYILPEQYHLAAFEALYQFCCYPNYRCAVAYFSLVHNEEFGVGKYIDKRTQLQLRLILFAIFSKQWRQKFKDFLINTSWPQGYLAKYHLFPVLKVYNALLERHDIN